MRHSGCGGQQGTGGGREDGPRACARHRHVASCSPHQSQEIGGRLTCAIAVRAAPTRGEPSDDLQRTPSVQAAAAVDARDHHDGGRRPATCRAPPAWAPPPRPADASRQGPPDPPGAEAWFPKAFRPLAGWSGGAAPLQPAPSPQVPPSPPVPPSTRTPHPHLHRPQRPSAATRSRVPPWPGSGGAPWFSPQPAAGGTHHGADHTTGARRLHRHGGHGGGHGRQSQGESENEALDHDRSPGSRVFCPAVAGHAGRNARLTAALRLTR